MKRIVLLGGLGVLLGITAIGAAAETRSLQARQQALQEQYGASQAQTIQTPPEPNHSFTSDREQSSSFDTLLVKNRAAAFPIMHNGQTLYKFTSIPNYQECYHVGELAGNIQAPGAVRNVYNVTIVSDPNVTALVCPIRIGNIHMSGRAGQIVNTVTIQGQVNSLARSVAIGNISVGRGGVEHLSNTVEIQGNVTVW